MKNLILLFLFFSCYQILPQTFPDYKERLHPFITDTSFIGQDFQVSATEGVIDPEEYILAPGDRLFISINGIEEIPINAIINQEGFIYIPKVGGIDLSHQSLSTGRKRIIDEINRYYRNVDVFVSLFDFRKIKVSLVGDVKKPSSYILSGNSRLVDLVMISRGFNETSDLRNIRILTKDGNEYSYDFLSFLRRGDRGQNPLLIEGDVVIINKVDKTVSISGQIMYPGSYEYVDGELARDLIQLAGGLLSSARKDSVEIVRFNSDGRNQQSSYFSYDELTNGSFRLNNKDHIMIRSIPEYLEEKYVLLKGYVKYPGYYKILEDRTKLSEIIMEAGGFRSEASLIEASLYRESGSVELDPEYERLKLIPRQDMTDDEYDYLKAKSRQRKGNVVIDFERLFLDKVSDEDIFLKRGDVINVPEEKNYIILIGQVISPGNMIYKEGLNFKDYIMLAGGYGWRALEGDVRIVRAKTGEWVDADEDVMLEPGDTIWVPEDPPGPKFWDVFMDTLTILGQMAAVIAAVVAVIAVSR